MEGAGGGVFVTDGDRSPDYLERRLEWDPGTGTSGWQTGQARVLDISPAATGSRNILPVRDLGCKDTPPILRSDGAIALSGGNDIPGEDQIRCCDRPTFDSFDG